MVKVCYHALNQGKLDTFYIGGEFNEGCGPVNTTGGQYFIKT